MGYGVYEDTEHGRWAGYMVPAECDMPRCENKITRGMDYKCDSHAGAEVDGEYVSVEEGCGLFFCHSHLYDGGEAHADVEAKPDSGEWMRWMLTDGSWEEWRAENPERVATMCELVAQLPLEEPDLDGLEIAGRLNFRGDIRPGLLLRKYDTPRYGLTIPVDLTYDLAADRSTITLARQFVEAADV